jgi:hypothetical protein
MIESYKGTCSVIVEDHGRPTLGSAVMEPTRASETPVKLGLSGFSLVKPDVVAITVRTLSLSLLSLRNHDSGS